MSLCGIISYHTIDLCIRNQGIYHTVKISGSHLITNLFFEKIKAQKACFMLIETPKNYILGEIFENVHRFRGKMAKGLVTCALSALFPTPVPPLDQNLNMTMALA